MARKFYSATNFFFFLHTSSSCSCSLSSLLITPLPTSSIKLPKKDPPKTHSRKVLLVDVAVEAPALAQNVLERTRPLFLASPIPMSQSVPHEELTSPTSPKSGGAVAYQNTNLLPKMASGGALIAPASIPVRGGSDRLVALELEDGTVYQGYNFGAEKSVSGELVFQTGMVGYPESITDPSYRGQILVITFPLVGNYGVPDREQMDELLKTLPKYFESTQIHVAALVVATYAGEDFSHFLAKSSLGQWLKEQGVPAMHGVDTRALTKRIRQKGSMLGRMLLQNTGATAAVDEANWKSQFEQIDWVDPNTKNLVAEGESF